MNNKTINVAIFEDEYYTAEDLRQILSDMDPQYHVVGVAEDVVGGVELLKRNRIDLIFADIELCDGKSFEIFRRFPNRIPTIITTAYSQYQDHTEDINVVDYMLKPIAPETIRKAVSHFQEEIVFY